MKTNGVQSGSLGGLMFACSSLRLVTTFAGKSSRRSKNRRFTRIRLKKLTIFYWQWEVLTPNWCAFPGLSADIHRPARLAF